MYSFPIYVPEFALRFPAQRNEVKPIMWMVSIPDEFVREGVDFVSFSVVFFPRDDFEKDLNKMYIIDFEAHFTVYRDGKEYEQNIRHYPLAIYLRDLEKVHQIFIKMPGLETGDMVNLDLTRRTCEHGFDTFKGHMDIWGGTIDINMNWEIEGNLPAISPVAEREPFHVKMN
jgi:hypothetical protein